MRSSAPFPQARSGLTGWPWTEPTEALKVRAENCQDKLPAITVITPSYNQGHYLEATIRSVLLQRYPKLQYIVVDGGSHDQSSDVIAKYRDFIDHIIQEPDRGQADAINKGLKSAHGEWFNWINSDDLLAPGTLWHLAAMLMRSRSQADLCAFRVQAFDDQRDLYIMDNRNLTAIAMLRSDNYAFSQPGIWFRLDHVHAIGGIDTTLHYGFDWDLMVRYLASYERVQYHSKIGACFRLHDQSKTVIELSKTDESQNRFKLESDRIRTKLERTLSGELAVASRLGRLREPWNQQIAQMMDDTKASPLGTAWKIIRQSAADPRVKLSLRTTGAVLRLLSRYIRPRFYKSAVSEP